MMPTPATPRALAPTVRRSGAWRLVRDGLVVLGLGLALALLRSASAGATPGGEPPVADRDHRPVANATPLRAVLDDVVAPLRPVLDGVVAPSPSSARPIVLPAGPPDRVSEASAPVPGPPVVAVAPPPLSSTPEGGDQELSPALGPPPGPAAPPAAAPLPSEPGQLGSLAAERLLDPVVATVAEAVDTAIASVLVPALGAVGPVATAVLAPLHPVLGPVVEPVLGLLVRLVPGGLIALLPPSVTEAVDARDPETTGGASPAGLGEGADLLGAIPRVVPRGTDPVILDALGAPAPAFAPVVRDGVPAVAPDREPPGPAPALPAPGPMPPLPSGIGSGAGSSLAAVLPPIEIPAVVAAGLVTASSLDAESALSRRPGFSPD